MVRSVAQARGGLFNMTNNWIKPIYDRTQEDVDFAINKIAEWITYNISSAEYDEKVRIENEELMLREGRVENIDNDVIVVGGDGRAIVDNDVLVVKIGVVYDLKGCLNALDINRIENNIEYLSNKLNELYYSSFVNTKQWTRDNLHTTIDMARIIDNVRTLITSFYQVVNAPPLPSKISTYEDVNQLEKNIDLIKYLLDCMINSFRQSGTLKSGTTTFLPLRR